MFKGMKLGTKIGAGFAALIIIAISLGSLAVWNMNNVKSVTTALAEERMPEVNYVNQLERESLNTMYAARGYAFTDRVSFLSEARKSIENAKAVLQSSKDHAAKTDNAELKDVAAQSEVQIGEYERLLNETVAKTDSLAKDTTAMKEAGEKYMKALYEFLGTQTNTMQQEIGELAKNSAAQASSSQSAGSSEAAKIETAMQDRLRKITMANEAIDYCNLFRLSAWRAISARDMNAFEEATKIFDKINVKLDELKSITHQDHHLKLIEDCRTASVAYVASVRNFMNNWNTREEVGVKRGQAAAAVLSLTKTSATKGLNEASKISTEAASSLSAASMTMIVGLGIGVLVGIALAIFITRSITGPINRIIAGLTSSAEQTASASGQVAAASQSLAQGSSEQAAAIEETSSSIEEMASMTKQNAANANEAKTLAASAQSSADKGNAGMGRMSKAIDDIKKSSDETAKIIKTIDEIAFQTNLLALNAAVEAARAGEAGKGFAVVAEEVRNLAQRSAEAAKNTANMIEGSVKNADNGVQICQEVAKVLEEIGTGSQKVNELIGEIAAASNEQAQGIEQVNTAVGQMDTVTQQNAANAEESASASEELSAQAVELTSMVRDLQVLVGGQAAATIGEGHASAHGAGSAKTAKASPEHRMPGGVESPRRQAVLAGHKEHKAEPSEVIPLDDKEMAKF